MLIVNAKLYIPVPITDTRLVRRNLCQATADYGEGLPTNSHGAPFCIPIDPEITPLDVQRAYSQEAKRLQNLGYRVSYETPRENVYTENLFCIDTAKTRDIHVNALHCPQ